MAAVARKPRLLLCFDAFGTLFHPRQPISQQYADVARQFGLSGFTVKDLERRLFAAVKEESRVHPNYGKTSNLGATEWWSNVIRKTFEPLLGHGQTLPSGLAPALMHRFSCKDGYEAESQTIPSLRSLRTDNRENDSLLSSTSRLRRYDRIIVGIITNSDDRIPDVLLSLGVDVSPLRSSATAGVQAPSIKPHDIDFLCMSYDVGAEKPDGRIFRAAEDMLVHIIQTREGRSMEESRADAEGWEKLYVGDEYAKDVVGARDAGWKAALLVPESDVQGQAEHAAVANLEDHPRSSFQDIFTQHPFVKVRSIQNVIRWVRGEQ